MRGPISRHPRIAAGLLSTGSLALVFAAALGVIPPNALPRSSPALLGAIPHINAGVSIVAIAVIGSGWRAIRQDRIRHHRAAMLTGFALFVSFLVLYLYKVILEGPTAFPGPAVIDRFVYVPLLIGHIGLAIVTLPLLYYVLVLGVTRPPAQIARSLHPRIGRVAVSLWILSFFLGILVYLMLYILY